MGVNEEYSEQFSAPQGAAPSKTAAEILGGLCGRSLCHARIDRALAELEHERDEAIERRPSVIDLDNMRRERERQAVMFRDEMARVIRERDEAREKVRFLSAATEQQQQEEASLRAEVERLRAEIRAAPHGPDCSAGFSTIDGGPFDATHCDCWKRTALNGEGE